MPRSSRYGPIGGLPGTIRRSCREVQVAFTQAYQDAVQAYGEGDRANRAAFAALKQKFEKRGDHWTAKQDADEA
ncbi:MAG: ChaB family protein [Streptosporangiaceae bacterium]